MNNLRQHRNIIYNLEREFGTLAYYRIVKSHDVNVLCGKVTREFTDYKIPRAIVLPGKEARKFVYDLSFIAANKNFTYGGYFDVTSRVVIIRKTHLPKNFDPHNNDYLVIDKRLYLIDSNTTTEGYGAWIFIVKQVNNMKDVEVVTDAD